MAVSIVYETHSITTDNEDGIATGWLPGHLSAAGLVAARELGERRRDDGIDVIYVSDLERALETVRVAFVGSAIPVRVDARLRECNYGLLNGMPRAQLEAERPATWQSRGRKGRATWTLSVGRAICWTNCSPQWDGKRVLLVAHSANRWALEHLLLGRDLERPGGRGLRLATGLGVHAGANRRRLAGHLRLPLDGRRGQDDIPLASRRLWAPLRGEG